MKGSGLQRGQGDSVQNWEISSRSVGISDNDIGFPTPILSDFPNLATLLATQRELSATNLDAPKKNPISIEALEILEAELTNQGILPKAEEHALRVSQLASYESSMLRWRARRAGYPSIHLAFSVSLIRYVASIAEEMVEIVRRARASQAHPLGPVVLRSITAHPRQLSGQLSYLEAYAAYLNGSYELPETSYQKGLNTLLKVLSTAESNAEEAQIIANGGALSVVLPVSPADFLQNLRRTAQSINNRRA